MNDYHPHPKKSSGLLFGVIGYLAGVATTLAVVLAVFVAQPELRSKDVAHQGVRKKTAKKEVAAETEGPQPDKGASKADRVIAETSSPGPSPANRVGKSVPDKPRIKGAEPQATKSTEEVRSEEVTSEEALPSGGKGPDVPRVARPLPLLSTVRLQSTWKKSLDERLPQPRFSTHTIEKLLDAAEKTPFDPELDQDAIVEGVKTYLARAFPPDSITQVTLYAPRWWSGEAWQEERYVKRRLVMVPCHFFDTYKIAEYRFCFACLETEVGIDFFPFECRQRNSVNPAPPFFSSLASDEEPIFRTNEINEASAAILESFGMEKAAKKLKRLDKKE